MAALSKCRSAFMEDQPSEVVREVGQGHLRLSPRQSDRTDEEAVSALLLREDMLDRAAYRGLARVGPRHRRRHRLARRRRLRWIRLTSPCRASQASLSDQRHAVSAQTSDAVFVLSITARSIPPSEAAAEGAAPFRMNPKRRSMLIWVL